MIEENSKEDEAMLHPKYKSALLALAVLLTVSILLGGCQRAVDPDPTPDTEQTQETTRESGTSATEETLDIMQKSDPAEDDTLNILMIGNSFCYYYPDELYGLAKAEGIKVRVCNVYYSGCTLKQHCTWWLNGEENYQFFTYDWAGRKKLENRGLEFCLAQQNWDVISLQESGSKLLKSSAEESLKANSMFRQALVKFIKEQFPRSELYWHQTWAYQLGYNRGGIEYVSALQQRAYAKQMKKYAIDACEDSQLTGRINTGEAWEIARLDPRVGDILCNRLKDGGDFYHDGDIGGGQYLNACVWFEILTGKSCVGNTFRPGNYTLSEELVTALQECAHQAVENLKAE